MPDPRASSTPGGAKPLAPPFDPNDAYRGILNDDGGPGSLRQRIGDAVQAVVAGPDHPGYSDPDVRPLIDQLTPPASNGAPPMPGLLGPVTPAPQAQPDPLGILAPPTFAFGNAQPHGATRYNPAGVDFIKRWEDFKARAYNSPEGGSQTIGWGHKIQPGETFPGLLGAPAADRLLFSDLDPADALVGRATHGIALTQPQRDGVDDFAYNAPKAFRTAADNGFLRLLQKGDVSGAADRMLLWDKALDPKTGQKRSLGDLTRRREAERNLILKGDYGAH
jgi:GH24 family phage-related lysozyme (muramidase)